MSSSESIKPSICVIDDQIPAIKDNTIKPGKILNISNLNSLLKEKWSERELKDLIKKLVEEDWNVNAFINTQLFLNYLEEENYRAEIIIFDWDTGSPTPKKDFYDILQKCFSVIAIYSKRDKQQEIETAVSGNSDFSYYQDRFLIFYKEDRNSVNKLLEKATSMHDKNFSYRFGTKLRRLTLNSLEKVLVELGKISIEEVVWLFGELDESDDKRKLSNHELIAMMIEKLRNDLNSKDLDFGLPELSNSPPKKIDNNITKKICSYRMYYKPADDLVRQGDLIKKKDNLSTSLYCVISSNCHLVRFWKKNLGFLTLVPLYRIDENNKELKKKLELFQASSKLKKRCSTSIANPVNFEGPVILSALEVEPEKFYDYLFCPKEIFNIEIPLPKINGINQKKRYIPLLYDHIKDYDGSERIAISEPFLTALIQHLLNNITGYGAPDYPKELLEIQKKNWKKFINETS